MHGSDEQPGEPRAQPHDLPVLVPGGRVAGDAADHEADQRPADQAGEGQHARSSRRCRGCRAGSRRAPGRRRCRRTARDMVTNSQPMPMPTSALTTNCTVERCTSRTTSSTTRRRDADDQRGPQVLGGQPEDGEDDRRDGRLDHAAPAAERLGELAADDRLDGLDGRLGRARRLDAARRSRDQLVARVVHDPGPVVRRRSGPRPRSPRPGRDAGDPPAAEPDDGDHAGAVVRARPRGRVRRRAGAA